MGDGRYLVSVDVFALQQNPGFLALTTPGNSFGGSRTRFLGVAGESSRRCWYLAPSDELESLVGHLQYGIPDAADIFVQKATKSNVPENLLENYRQYL